MISYVSLHQATSQKHRFAAGVKILIISRTPSLSILYFTPFLPLFLVPTSPLLPFPHPPLLQYSPLSVPCSLSPFHSSFSLFSSSIPSVPQPFYSWSLRRLTQALIHSLRRQVSRPSLLSFSLTHSLTSLCRVLLCPISFVSFIFLSSDSHVVVYFTLPFSCICLAIR